MSLTHLPTALRPREKLLDQGAGALADAELLALLIRTGTRGQNVLQLAQTLLDSFGGWSALLHSDVQSLSMVKGLGPAKRAELLAVMEIAKRSLVGRLRERPVFDHPEAVKQFAAARLRHLDHEAFAVLFLDAQHRLIEMQTLFRGTLTQTAVYPREVVKHALAAQAAAVILAHNHPSGVAEPSRADETLTDTLKRALALVDVRVLDHLVVGHDSVLSFAERGLL
jgi:DNA repair protein RadC